MQCVECHCLESWSCKQRTVGDGTLHLIFVCMLPEVLELLCDLHWTDALLAWSNRSRLSPELIRFGAFEP